MWNRSAASSYSESPSRSTWNTSAAPFVPEAQRQSASSSSAFVPEAATRRYPSALEEQASQVTDAPDNDPSLLLPPHFSLDNVERNHVVWGGFDKNSSSDPSSTATSGVSCHQQSAEARSTHVVWGALEKNSTSSSAVSGQERGGDPRLVTASGMVDLVETPSSTSTSNSRGPSRRARVAEHPELHEYEDSVPRERKVVRTTPEGRIIPEGRKYYDDGSKRPRPRPFKGQRLRRRKQVAKLFDQVNENPEAFDIETAQLPPSMHKSERVKKKMADRLTTHKANLLREMSQRRLMEGAGEDAETVRDISRQEIGRTLPTYPTQHLIDQQKKEAAKEAAREAREAGALERSLSPKKSDARSSAERSPSPNKSGSRSSAQRSLSPKRSDATSTNTKLSL